MPSRSSLTPDQALSSPPTVPAFDAADALRTDVVESSAWPLERWQALAQDPGLFQGWRRDVRSGEPLVLDASCLAVRKVAARFGTWEPVNWKARSWTLRHATLRGDAPLSALAATLFAVPRQDSGFPNLQTAWLPGMRASQEVIVGLLLAAGAPIDAHAWAFCAPGLTPSSLGQPVSGDGPGRSTVNPRLLDRLLSTGQRLPPVLTIEGDSAPTLLSRMARSPGLWSQATVLEVIRRGVDVNARNLEDGSTALHVAVNALGLVPSRESLGPALVFVKTLLDAGADPSIRDHHGREPLHLAAGQDRADAMVMLVEHGASWDSVWCRPAHGCPTPGGDHNDDHADAPGAMDPDAWRVHPGTRFDGWLMAHIAAAQATTVATLDQLLAWGASADAPDLMHGNTPLHLAAFHHNPWAVERLLAAGVSRDTPNRAGQTAHDLLELEDPSGSVNDAPDPAALDAIRVMFERWDLHQALHETPGLETQNGSVRPRPRL